MDSSHRKEISQRDLKRPKTLNESDCVINGVSQISSKDHKIVK
jgi:hypothetical protein